MITDEIWCIFDHNNKQNKILSNKSLSLTSEQTKDKILGDLNFLLILFKVCKY